MSMIRIWLLMVLLIISVSPGTASPWAREPAPLPSSLLAMTLDGAVDQARKHYNGRVLSAETLPGKHSQGADAGANPNRNQNRANATHQIRVLTDDGRVRRLRFDAETGRPLKPRR